MQNILLIDDDEDDIFFHTRAINKCGEQFNIDVCCSGDDALDYFQNKGAYSDRKGQPPEPDVVFLDVNMPRVNGWEFLDCYSRIMNKSRDCQNPLFIMLTTSANATDQQRAQESELVFEYMEKPLRTQDMQRIVDQYTEFGRENSA